MKNKKPTHPLVTSFYDLENFGETLFATAPAAPTLSRQKKRAILALIIPTRSMFRLQFGLASAAFATFVLVFSLAQTSGPTSPFYKLRVGDKPVGTVPIIKQQETIKIEIQKQQTTVDTLKKTGAPAKQVEAAEKTLNKSIESGKKLGIDVEKVIKDARKTDSEKVEAAEKIEINKDSSTKKDSRTEVHNTTAPTTTTY